MCRRKLGKRSVSRRKEAMAFYSIESAAALGVSLVINICVVAVFAKVPACAAATSVEVDGCPEIQNPQDPPSKGAHPAPM